ncbi:MAG: hypothetical protein ABWY81_06105 [Jiangellaceae bacterium]
MTQPNPFAPPAPAAPVAEPAPSAPANPFGQPAAYTPPAAAPAAPAWLAQPTPVEQASYVRPEGVTHMQHVAATTPAAAPPALNVAGLVAAPPPPPSGGRGADLAAMYGRLVLVLPLHIETVQRNPQFITPEQRAAGNTTQEKLTATVVVLDDGQGGQSPIAWGGAPHKMPPTPHTNTDPLPYVRKAMWINQSRLISQLKQYLPAAPGGAPGMAIGRVVKTGPNHNDPWFLTTATEQEVAVGQFYLEAVGRGQFPHPLAP